MTNHQKDQILKVVEYYMTPELREKIMREVPVAYNAWVGYPVVEVVMTCDNHPPAVEKITEKESKRFFDIEEYNPT